MHCAGCARDDSYHSRGEPRCVRDPRRYRPSLNLDPAWTFALTLAAALGSGLIAGVFFAFSVFVMKALGRLPAGQGIAAMQAVNVVVLNPCFLGVLLGTAVLSLLALSLAWSQWGSPQAAWLAAGSAAYLLGCLGVTMTCNVPRNEALARVTPGSRGAEALWADYLKTWTAWNHVRTLASLAAAAAFTVALAA